MAESYRRGGNYMMGNSNEDMGGVFMGNFFLPALLLVIVCLTVIALIVVRRYKKYVH